ncbi:MAG: GTP 3',8-cyclase MoaA [Bacteroidetes bacterium]|nr:GTP 3',8-cyclase MoaA [Bacteroidota bacterium]
MIVDQHSRVHDYLRISLTERCNLRCFYCMPEEGILLRPRNDFMSFEEVVAMAKTFVSLGVKKIRLTGGEPLIRKDAKEIFKALSELPVELAITTNGILVDDYMDTFQSCGIKSINVSLDSLKEEKFNSITRRDYFSRVTANIESLLDKKFHVKVNAVVIKGVNDDEVCDFVSWTRNRNVHVRFIEFMPFQGNKWDWSKGVSFKEMMSIIETRFGNNIIKLDDGKNDTAKNYAIADHLGTFAIISSVTNPFCDTCNRIRLTADGKMKNCLFSSSETDLLSAMRAGEDIEPLILKSIWGKKALRGGIETLDDFAKQKNRTMVAIGG